MKHLLVIDDETDIREIVQMSCELSRDWQVDTAASGSEGLARAREERPDAILLDVMMPEMDGIDIFTRLRADEHTRMIPVILLTAKVQMADQRRFANLDVAGVIAKPFDPIALAGQIENLLGW